MRTNRRMMLAAAVATAMTILAGPGTSAADRDVEKNSTPLGATTVIIELTDNDIELQEFVDGSGLWRNLGIFDPQDRKIFDLRPQTSLGRQGMSELFFASNPSHFPEDENGEIDPEGTIAVVEAFLRRFPAGTYEAEVRLPGGMLEGETLLTHVLPALPEILAPVSATDDPPVVDPNDLVIEWEPVTTRFIGEGPVDIIEYQVILDQVDPLRAMPWVDGGTRRALINLPGTVTSLTVPPEFLIANASYEFEVLAIEASGNSTISVGEFVTE